MTDDGLGLVSWKLKLTLGVAVGAGADGDGVCELVWVGKASSPSTVVWP